MPKRQLIIYCDESADKGRFFSHFYGGALIEAARREAIEKILNAEKAALNLHKELKWVRITENYEAKYLGFIEKYFDLVENGDIKLRIMFTQNIHEPNLGEYQVDNEFFMLYYQLIKHAFGLRYCNPSREDDVAVSLFLDDVPIPAKFHQFKKYVHALCHYPVFARAKVMIREEDITDVRSHDHVILQGLDIVLGAMQFRLNDMHKEIPARATRRGKRTRAKERVYKYINSRIRKLYPGFNIGISTGQPNGETDRWTHPYRHWRFIPSDHNINLARGKKQRKGK